MCDPHCEQIDLTTYVLNLWNQRYINLCDMSDNLSLITMWTCGASNYELNGISVGYSCKYFCDKFVLVFVLVFRWHEGRICVHIIFIEFGRRMFPI